MTIFKSVPTSLKFKLTKLRTNKHTADIQTEKIKSEKKDRNKLDTDNDTKKKRNQKLIASLNTAQSF